MIDERDDSLTGGAFIMSMEGIRPAQPSLWGWASWPGYYHNGSCGLSFADGHAETHRWLDPRTTPKRASRSGGDGAPHQPNNQDILWLGLRTTGLK